METDLKEVERESVDWIRLSQDGVQYFVNTVMNLRIYRRRETS
jgi:hypothetical protein